MTKELEEVDVEIVGIEAAVVVMNPDVFKGTAVSA